MMPDVYARRQGEWRPAPKIRHGTVRAPGGGYPEREVSAFPRAKGGEDGMAGTDGTGTRARGRLWRWRRNPLRRRCDLLEAWLGLVALLLIVVLAPGVAALTATGVAHETLRQGEELHRATAVLTAPAPETVAPNPGEGFPLGAGEDRVLASARWTAPDGTTSTGTAPAEPGSDAGTRVLVWLDDEGERQQAPPSPSEAWAGGVMTGAATGALTGLVVLGVQMTLRCQLDAWRERRWAREWAEVGPEWSGPRHR
jgi:hypothetical protein